MPQLTKEALSGYVRRDCERFLHLKLHSEAERKAAGLPLKQKPRPGLPEVQRRGKIFEREKYADLVKVFGTAAVLGKPDASVSPPKYQTRVLDRSLASVRPGQFVIEAEFAFGTALQMATGVEEILKKHNIQPRRLRPDIIEVREASHWRQLVEPDGSLVPCQTGDTRLQLRIIDVKLSSEPSKAYLMEVVLYSMALAGWLKDENLDDQLVVAAAPAIWAGSFEDSALVRVHEALAAEGGADLSGALAAWNQEDLEAADVDLFAPRIREILSKDIGAVMIKDWRSLSYHVDNRCIGCDFLGGPWKDKDGPTWRDDHCMPEANSTQHLSQVAYLSRGGAKHLQSRNVQDLPTLAELGMSSPILATHQSLKARRHVVPERAQVLAGKQPATIANGAGTSGVLPRWADLRIYVSTDFDVASARTIGFAVSAVWIQPFSAASDGERTVERREARAFIAKSDSAQEERRILLEFLQEMQDIIDWGQAQGQPNTTFQVYLWDDLQLRHLKRVLERHLDVILGSPVEPMVWLIPPESVLPNKDITNLASPVTVVNNDVRGLLAAPIPHYYTLLAVARKYHYKPAAGGHAPKFSVAPLFEDPLSSQIPSERGQALWAAAPGTHEEAEALAGLQEAMEKKLFALAAIVARLEKDLRPTLTKSAKAATIRQPTKFMGMSDHGRAWLHHILLDAGYQAMQNRLDLSMGVDEQEARLRALVLSSRLPVDEERRELDGRGITESGARVYRINEDSIHVRFKESEFGLIAIPRRAPHIIDEQIQKVYGGIDNVPKGVYRNNYATMDRVLSVNVPVLDRRKQIVVVVPYAGATMWGAPNALDQLEDDGVLNLSNDVVVVQLSKDFFSPKLQDVVKSLGRPSNEPSNPVLRRSMGHTAQASRDPVVPLAACLWEAHAWTTTPSGRNTAPLRSWMEAQGLTLNKSQWKAWENALSTRSHLIHGPPGTGKTRTLQRIILSALKQAVDSDKNIRVLVTAGTYNAVANVLEGLAKRIDEHLPGSNILISRLKSASRENLPTIQGVTDVAVNKHGGGSDQQQLISNLQERTSLQVVGAAPDQVYDLSKSASSGGTPLFPVFDFVVVDEAAQLPMAKGVVSLAAVAANASIIIAGDPEQLPPIQHVKPPEALDGVLGSLYAYYKSMGVAETPLEVNYRSNNAITTFQEMHVYGHTITAYSPDQRIALAHPLPDKKPEGWPSQVEWDPAWCRFLDPRESCIAFTYPDGFNGQANEFEAKATAAMVWLLRNHLDSSLEETLDAHHNRSRPSGNAHRPESFWKSAIGIVTPHRAQQALMIDTLVDVFGAEEEHLIRDAVDTVERFQGGERDVIIGAYSLGDPDMIRDEEDFIFNPNRFNVMTSRARAKVVLLLTEEVARHLSDDLEVLRDSKLLKSFAYGHCRSPQALRVPNGQGDTVEGILRTR